MRLNKLTKVAIAALEDIKARDIVVLDVRKMTALYDTLIIATAESARQTKALSSHLREDLRAAGGHVIGSEGEDSGEWVLVDCSDFVVHIMQPAVRAHYNLEELWTPPEPVRPVRAKTRATSSTAAKAKSVPKPATERIKDTAAPASQKRATTKKPAATKVDVKKVAAKKTASAKPAVKIPNAKPPTSQTRRRLKEPT
jgi:ribosome-associated protein